MAVSLSATLSAHAASSPRKPHLLVTAQPEAFAFPRLEWQRLWHDDSADDPSAAAISAAGYLIRVRNVGGTIHVSRINDPTAAAATWTTWDTSFATSASGRGVAIAAHPSNGEVVVAYSRSNTLYQRVSSDSGVNWAAESTIVAEAAAPTAVALAYRTSTGNLCAFLTFGTSVRRCRRTSGTWAGTSTAWSLSMATVTGLAAVHDGSDFALLVTGTQVTTTHKRVFATRMGDVGLPLNTWAALVTVAESDAASGLTYHSPSLIVLGSAGFYGTFAAHEAGDVAVERTWWTHTAYGGTASSTWLEPAPHEHRSAYGLALAVAPDGGSAIASSATAVYRAPLGDSVELTDQLVSARVSFAPTSTSAELVFDDASGNLLAATSFQDALELTHVGDALQPGHQLTLAPGYVTSGGAEYGVTWKLLIDRVSTAFSRNGSRRYTVHCSGPWERAARWRAPQASQVASGTLTRAALFARVAGRAGVPVSEQSQPYATSVTWEAYSPSFAHIAGESGKATLERLLRPVADVAAPDSSNGGFLLRSWEDPRWEAVMRRLGPAYWFRLHDRIGAAGCQEEISGQNLVYGGSNNGVPVLEEDGPLVAQPTASNRFASVTYDTLTDHATKAWYASATNWTLLCLVKPTARNARSVLVYNGLAVPSTGDGYAVCLLSNGHLGYLAEWIALDDMGVDVPLDEWSFVALTRDTTTVRAYLDGVVSGTTSASVPVAPSSTFTIGGQWAGASYGNSTDGWIAEAALFERALTGEELALLQEARDPAQHTFGGSGHPIRVAEPGVESPGQNWSRVTSDIGNYADDFDAASVYRDGARRGTLRVLDANSDAKVEAYAEGVLLGERAAGGDLTAPWHPGLQLGDVISLDDATPDVSLWRVVRLTLDFERGDHYDALLSIGSLR